MASVTSAQNAGGGRDRGTRPQVTSIPLSEDMSGAAPGEDQSLGTLVRDATTHLSTLVRAEIELAKGEIASEVRKGIRGSVFFIIALTVLLFSSFFFFFGLAELLADLGLYRSAAFGIVFVLMLVVAVLFALMGYKKVRTIRGPQRTIQTMRDNASALRPHSDGDPYHHPMPDYPTRP
jgi:uncharacterized membrane protein YqjE